MRIGVIGLGAIGGVMAERLMTAGLAPSLAAGRHAGVWKKNKKFFSASETLPQDQYDLILLCTRTAETETALTPAAPFLKPDGAVVCLQNGLPEDRAARIVGPGRVLGAVIGWSASQTAPGETQVTGGGKFILGGPSPRLNDAAAVLKVAFPVKLTDNLQGARWSKLAMNCAMSTLGAISGLTLGELAKTSRTRTLALAVVREVVQQGTATGIHFEPVAGIRPDWLAKAPAPLAHLAIWLAARRRPNQRTGMIARLEQGRSAGIDDLNALIGAPLNRQLTAMVRQIETRVRAISPKNLAEITWT